MLILFIIFGALTGAAAASTALWLGSSLLMVLVSYSVFGSLGMLLIAFVMFMYSEFHQSGGDWHEGQKSGGTVSA